MGAVNVIEEAVKAVLKDHPKATNDELFSYLLGKLDSKLLSQATLCSLRRQGSPCHVRVGNFDCSRIE